MIIPQALVIGQESATADAAAAVEAFQTALRSGVTAAVERLIAEDALMVEGGNIETRAQYLQNHLPADIEFERAVTGARTPVHLVVRGDTAWAVTSADFKGTFETRPVDLVGIELMVLSREPVGWRIRAIHWSSRNRRPAN